MNSTQQYGMIHPDERIISQRISLFTSHYNIESTDQGIQVELFTQHKSESPSKTKAEDILTSVIKILTQKGYTFSLERDTSTYTIDIRKQLDPRIGHEYVDEYHPEKITDEILSTTNESLPPIKNNRQKITLFSNSSDTDEVYLVEGDFIRQIKDTGEEVYFYVVGINNNQIINYTIGRAEWKTVTNKSLEEKLAENSDCNNSYTLIPNTLTEATND